MKSIFHYSIFSLIFLLAGCTNSDHNVPVTTAWHQKLPSALTYTVQPGDSLYSIAWAFDVDYQTLATQNNLTPPSYKIETGQKLKITGESNTSDQVVTAAVPAQPSLPAATPSSTHATPATQTITQKPIAAPCPAPQTGNISVQTTLLPVHSVTRAGISWNWPAQGKIISGYQANSLLNKGIDITGKLGSPVVAAANGKVVYAGSGLRGYGNLIIIKHNNTFLSAYAHNQKLLVTEGQAIKAGQVIARMGNTDCKRVILHFEIRQNGKPVDPLNFLPTH